MSQTKIVSSSNFPHSINLIVPTFKRLVAKAHANLWMCPLSSWILKKNYFLVLTREEYRNDTISADSDTCYLWRRGIHDSEVTWVTQMYSKSKVEVEHCLNNKYIYLMIAVISRKAYNDNKKQRMLKKKLRQK